MKISSEMKSDKTRQQIKKAAREVFLRNGLDGARNEEIALLSNTSPALISYYFKSKEKLFDETLIEVYLEFIEKAQLIANNPATNFEMKLRELVDCYSDMTIDSPHLPIFSILKIRMKNRAVVTYTMQMRNMLHKSIMASQLREQVKAGKFKDITMAHVLMNIVSLTLFPALAAPVLQTIGDTREEGYRKLIRERQKQIADWVLFTLR